MAGTIGIHAKASAASFSTVTTPTRTSAASGSTFVVICTGLSGSAPVITDSKSNSWAGSQVGVEQDTGAASVSCWMFRIENATGGALHTFTATGGNYPTIMVVELLGMLTSSVYDSATLSQGIDSASPFTRTTGTLSQADEILVAGLVSNSGSTSSFAESSGFTVQENETDGSNQVPGCLATRIVSGVATYTPSFTDAATSTAGIIVAGFKIAGGGGATATASPGVGLVTSGGLVPVEGKERTVLPSLGAVTAAGLIASESKERTVTPNVGASTVGGLVPTVPDANTASPGVGAVTSTGLSPTLSGVLQSIASAGVGAVSVIGLAPTISSASATVTSTRRRGRVRPPEYEYPPPITPPYVPEPWTNPMFGQLSQGPADVSRVVAMEDRAREQAAQRESMIKAKKRRQNQRALELLLLE